MSNYIYVFILKNNVLSLLFYRMHGKLATLVTQPVENNHEWDRDTTDHLKFTTANLQNWNQFISIYIKLGHIQQQMSTKKLNGYNSTLLIISELARKKKQKKKKVV